MVAAMDEVGEAGTVEVGTKVGSRQQQKGHLESAEGRRYRKLEGQIRKARAAMRQVRGATQDDLDAATPMAVREYGALYPEFLSKIPSHPRTVQAEWAEKLEEELQTLNKERRAVLMRHDRKKRYEEERRQDDRLRYDTRRVHREVFGGTAPKGSLTAIRREDGTLDTDPGAVVAETERYFAASSRPVLGAEARRRPPWEGWGSDTVDRFELPTLRGRVPEGYRLGSTYNWQVYERVLSGLPGRKAPGPDGVLNEVIKNMPEAFHRALHELFVQMWETRRTPNEWKVALTILLYKKGDQHEVRNYRPIGLLNTVLKMWTAVVTHCLSDFVEKNGLLSPAQEGFRRGKNTLRQLKRLIMTMEDAQLTDSPLYVLYVDFVNAFGSVDHLRMADIMEMQGYPRDIVDIVRDLYEGAATRVRTPVGETGDIPNNGRGTVQGDPLSPLLFIIAMDPLLRWLQEGGRGYRFRTSHATTDALAYADDLAAVTGSMRDMRAQADKISRYCEWAGFEVNIDTVSKSKTAWTGPEVFGAGEQALQVMGKEIPRLAPDEPYVYLGVHLALDLDWSAHMAALTGKAELKLKAIADMRHSPELVMRTLESVVRPLMRYSMPTGAFGWEDVHRLNQRFGVAAKRVVGLSRKTSNLTLGRERREMGVVVDPLELTYAVAIMENIQVLNNSEEDLGVMWRGLVKRYRGMHEGGRIPHTRGFRTSRPTLNMLAQMQDIGVEWEGDTGVTWKVEDEARSRVYEAMLEANDRWVREGGKALRLKTLDCLWKVGLHRLTDLFGAGPTPGSGIRFLEGEELKRRHGPGVIKAEHVRAVRKVRLAMERPGNRDLWPRVVNHGSIADRAGWALARQRPGEAGGTGEWHLPSDPAVLQADTEGTVFTLDLTAKPSRNRRRYMVPHRVGGREHRAYDVENVVGEEYVMGVKHFRVKYKGYDEVELLRPEDEAQRETLETDLRAWRATGEGVACSLEGGAHHPLVGREVEVLVQEPHTVDESAPCVECGRAEDTEDDMIFCDGCGDVFHLGCHTPPIRATEVPDGGWCCHRCAGRGVEADSQGGRRALGVLYRNKDSGYPGYPYVVKFTTEVKIGSRSSAVVKFTTAEDLLPIFTDMRGRNRRLGDPPDHERGIHLPGEIRLRDTDGGRPRARLTDEGWSAAEALRERIAAGEVTLDALAADPYRDIKGTGDYELRSTRDGREGATMVHSYDRKGKWKGTMTAHRHVFLRSRWVAYWERRAGEEAPRRSFAWEVADLFDRYRPGATKGSGGKVDMRNHWTTQDEMREAIVRGYMVSEESFASPLNCLMMEGVEYCSAHPRDVVFGARYDAYKQPRKGMSAYMNPEYVNEELDKALRWAIAASQGGHPFCAVLVYPRFKMATYMELLAHRNVGLIAEFDRHSFAFKTPDHWQSSGEGTGAGTAKWPVMVIEVSNEAGRARFKSVNAEAAIIGAAVDAGAVLTTAEDRAFDTDPDMWLSQPRGFARVQAGRPPPLPKASIALRGERGR